MKHTKYLICELLAVCLLSVTAFADVIWEPNDDFYQQHYEECEYLGRSYYANGQVGFVMVFDTPVAENYVEHYLENGTELYVSFTMEYEGDDWGVVELSDGRTGWVAMSALTLIYDNQSFIEEHEAEFVPYDGSFEKLCTSENQRVIFWTYPGSGKTSGDFETLHQDYSPLQPDVMWTDGEGRVWGRIGYYMAARGWVCLSEPDNEDLPVAERSYDLYLPADPEPTDATVQSGGMAGQKPLTMTVCGAVALVCGITAVLIVRMKKKS